MRTAVVLPSVVRTSWPAAGYALGESKHAETYSLHLQTFSLWPFRDMSTGPKGTLSSCSLIPVQWFEWFSWLKTSLQGHGPGVVHRLLTSPGVCSVISSDSTGLKQSPIVIIPRFYSFLLRYIQSSELNPCSFTSVSFLQLVGPPSAPSASLNHPPLCAPFLLHSGLLPYGPGQGSFSAALLQPVITTSILYASK